MYGIVNDPQAKAPAGTAVVLSHEGLKKFLSLPGYDEASAMVQTMLLSRQSVLAF